MKSGRGKQACYCNFICGGLPLFPWPFPESVFFDTHSFIKISPVLQKGSLYWEAVVCRVPHKRLAVSRFWRQKDQRGRHILTLHQYGVCVCLPGRNWGLLPFMVTLHQMCQRHSDLPDTSCLGLLGSLLRNNTVINTTNEIKKRWTHKKWPHTDRHNTHPMGRYPAWATFPPV